MSHVMQPYLDLLKDVYENGVDVSDRTGTGRRKVFGRQLRFKMSDGFPLDTSRPVPYISFIRELLWFIKGENNVNKLGSKIWDSWTLRKKDIQEFFDGLTDIEKEDRVHIVEEVNRLFGDTIGPLYGPNWRGAPGGTYNYFLPPVSESRFASDRLKNLKEQYENNQYIDQTTGEQIEFSKFLQYAYYEEIDQLNEVIRNLKERPYSSRHILSAWIPQYLPFEWIKPTENIIMGKGALAPCHVMQQYIVLPPKTETGKKRLSLMMTQRSLDIGPGGAFNLAQYSLLLHLVAAVTDMEPDEFIWSIGDAHIYLNQLDQVKEHISRTPNPAPELRINKQISNIYDFTEQDIEIINYNPNPNPIKYPISV